MMLLCIYSRLPAYLQIIHCTRDSLNLCSCLEGVLSHSQEQTLIDSLAMLGLQFPARFSLRRGSDSRRRCLPRASGEEAAEAERPAAKKKSQGISRMTVLQLKEEVRLILNFFVQNS